MTINNLEQFSNEFRTLLKENTGIPDLFKNGSEMLSQLVLSENWFQEILAKLLLDEEFYKSQLYSIDKNEIQLYRSPDKLFTIRAYIWDPKLIYPIHDHGSWSIIASHINEIRERKFIRLDDKSDENFGILKQIDDKKLLPGYTTVVLPIDDGIHQMESLNNKSAVSIHVYGNPIRKGFIRNYDINSNSIKYVYSPFINKKIDAIKTIGNFREPWSEEILINTFNSTKNEIIKKECMISLDEMK